MFTLTHLKVKQGSYSKPFFGFPLFSICAEGSGFKVNSKHFSPNVRIQDNFQIFLLKLGLMIEVSNREKISKTRRFLNQSLPIWKSQELFLTNTNIETMQGWWNWVGNKCYLWGFSRCNSRNFRFSPLFPGNLKFPSFSVFIFFSWVTTLLTLSFPGLWVFSGAKKRLFEKKNYTEMVLVTQNYRIRWKSFLIIFQ